MSLCANSHTFSATYRHTGSKKKNPKFGKCIHDFFKFAHNSFLVGLLVYNLKKRKNTKQSRLRSMRQEKLGSRPSHLLKVKRINYVSNQPQIPNSVAMSKIVSPEILFLTGSITLYLQQNDSRSDQAFRQRQQLFYKKYLKILLSKH